ncbi:MAG: dihydroorotate dehydrogenase [Bacteroidetes bacterium CG12_big_fil_rev_8_21_14_0_65_60_17]|nr:MAG: dihydroorotate dehydrogenase [Bacteroidetes bacterium CG12_big_fil_rev_8_21_14_0_65_60_17]
MKINTQYLGLELSSPLVPSASPLSDNVDDIVAMEDHGAGAVVLYSLFEEQIEEESRTLSHYLDHGSESYAESLSYFPDPAGIQSIPERYLEHIGRAKTRVDIPVIASLNGSTPGGWLQYARRIEEAGADALELNLYDIPTNTGITAAQVEERYLAVVRLVREEINIPVAVKISPFFTATAHFAQELCRCGASGIVLFNRFYQPDIDIERLDVVPRVHLSTSEEARLPIRWLAILYGRIPADLALTTGVHTVEDVVRGVMAGASVTMMASELLARGIGRIEEMNDALRAWLDEHGYDSLAQMCGSMSQIHVYDPSAFERANYMKTVSGWRGQRA